MIPTNRRVAAVILLLFVPALIVLAGDVATFVNLGFSPDSRTFAFAQYGIERHNNHPYAEIYVVDVQGNRFVSGGTFTRSFQTPVAVGSDGIGALFSLLPTATQVLQRQSVNHLLQGRLIYLLVNGREDDNVLNFRDFESGNRYRIELVQRARGSGTEGSAAFHLSVQVTRPDSRVHTVQVGRPDFFRTGVNAYRIRQVVLAPDERSIVAVVERITNESGGERIRYMVETVRLP